MRLPEKYINFFPRPLVRSLRNIRLAVLDVQDRISGTTDSLTPPRALHYVGGGDFKTIGRTFVDHFVRICGLTPDETVLDIGCGTGRMAVPLLDHLDKTGRYIGFDISKKAIAWCRKHISPNNPRFSFFFADICNKEYNPRGSVSATEYVFPCDDRSVDFAFATSVFTHMREVEVRHYLSEIRRVLKPAGRAWLNFFIVDQTTARLTAAGKAALNFNVELAGCYTIDSRTPERAIAFSESRIQILLQEAGLTLSAPVYHGAWSGRPDALESQDIVIVRKT